MHLRKLVSGKGRGRAGTQGDWGQALVVLVRTFVYEDETQIVPSGIFLVDFAKGRSEVEAAEK